MEIIDAHSHLGNNHYPNGGDLIEKIGVPQKKTDAISVVEKTMFRQTKFSLAMVKLFHRAGTNATIARIHTATRENMRKSMDEAGVSQTVCLPMSLNFVKFEDLVAAKQKDPGIIPFTGVDHKKDYDYEQYYAAHVKAGAKGMKLHPIVQRLPLTDKKTYAIVEAFAPYGLPILFHCGVVDMYYKGKEKANQTPELGAVKYAEELIRSFPKVNFVAGHAGTMQINDVIAKLAAFKNIWVDTSF